MKKIICFVIILMLALTACSVNDAEIKTPEENHLSTEEPTVSTEDENLSAEDEDLSTEEKRHPFTARAEQELLSRINDFTDGFYPLRDKGLEISAENIEVLDDIFFSYDLHIRKTAIWNPAVFLLSTKTP